MLPVIFFVFKWISIYYGPTGLLEEILSFFYLTRIVFVLSLSYLRTQSDKSFSNAELNTNVGWKSGIKAPASTVIDIGLSSVYKVPNF
jgi:hypothetical protein